ncbi:MAG TPA: DUF4010 domain-containing protein [Sphingomicrobium sp.]|jgi:uncharacterized membrane protein (DUF4010 family)
MDHQTALDLGASLAAGLIIGVERGWHLRREKAGTRIAGVRTHALIGAAGGLAAIIGRTIHPLVAAALVAAIAAVLVIAFGRETGKRDATDIVSAVLALALGLLAGAGEPAIAVAGAAVVTLILASRRQLHGFVDRLNATDVQAFARYAVIALAVLPFLPNRRIGPLDAWNPFQLWLVVVLITGFSFLGYIANRTIGERKGVLATAIIGGAYSSTAVTAAFSQQLGKGEEGPYVAGIILASAVMYLRIMILVGVLSPSTLIPFVIAVGPAALVGAAAAVIAWLRAPKGRQGTAKATGNPVDILPALGFVLIVAAGAVATRWAQQEYGQSGAAASLFITGTFDVDAAIVTLSSMPPKIIDREVAALAVAGTIITNMALKIFVAAIYARSRGIWAIAGMSASAVVLGVTIGAMLIA